MIDSNTQYNLISKTVATTTDKNGDFEF
jgi:hypothetical protein